MQEQLQLGAILVAYCTFMLARHQHSIKSAHQQAKKEFKDPLRYGYINNHSGQPEGLHAPADGATGAARFLYPELALSYLQGRGGWSGWREEQKQWVWKRMQEEPDFELYLKDVHRKLEEEEDEDDPRVVRRRHAALERAEEAKLLRARRLKSENDYLDVVEHFCQALRTLLEWSELASFYSIREFDLNPDHSANPLPSEYKWWLRQEGRGWNDQYDKIRLVECIDARGARYYIDFGKQLVNTTVVDVHVLDLPIFNGKVKRVPTKLRWEWSDSVTVTAKMILVDDLNNIINNSIISAAPTRTAANARGERSRRAAAELARALNAPS